MPNYYQPYYYPTPAQQVIMPQQQPQTPIQNPSQIQNGGFVSVRNENEVLNYPVAPGNYVTFKIEGQPIVMEKSMGFSQLEAPRIERYRLVKEEVHKNMPDSSQNELLDLSPINNTIDDLKSEIEAIWNEIEDIKNVRAKTTAKSTAKRDKDGGDD